MNEGFTFYDDDLIRACKINEQTGSVLCVIADWGERCKCCTNPYKMGQISLIVTQLMQLNWDWKNLWAELHKKAQAESQKPNPQIIHNAKNGNGIIE